MTKIELPIRTLDGKEAGKIELNPAVFGLPWQPSLIYHAVQAQAANRRTPIAHTKTRAEVSGGGRKPWRQKGTGRARHGSIRSPIWKGGGVTHGPRNTRNYQLKINRKAKRRALGIALSAKVADKAIVVVDSLSFEPLKTKTIAQSLKSLKLTGRVVIVPPEHNAALRRIVHNLEKVDILRADSLNVVDVLKAKTLLMSKEAIAVIEKTYQAKR